MNEDNIKAIEIDYKALPQIGTLCIICDRVIPIDYCYNPVTKICDECKKRIKKIIYEDGT